MIGYNFFDNCVLFEGIIILKYVSKFYALNCKVIDITRPYVRVFSFR